MAPACASDTLGHMLIPYRPSSVLRGTRPQFVPHTQLADARSSVGTRSTAGRQTNTTHLRLTSVRRARRAVLRALAGSARPPLARVADDVLR